MAPVAREDQLVWSPSSREEMAFVENVDNINRAIDTVVHGRFTGQQNGDKTVAHREVLPEADDCIAHEEMHFLDTVAEVHETEMRLQLGMLMTREASHVEDKESLTAWAEVLNQRCDEKEAQRQYQGARMQQQQTRLDRLMSEVREAEGLHSRLKGACESGEEELASVAAETEKLEHSLREAHAAVARMREEGIREERDVEQQQETMRRLHEEGQQRLAELQARLEEERRDQEKSHQATMKGIRDRMAAAEVSIAAGSKQQVEELRQRLQQLQQGQAEAQVAEEKAQAGLRAAADTEAQARAVRAQGKEEAAAIRAAAAESRSRVAAEAAALREEAKKVRQQVEGQLRSSRDSQSEAQHRAQMAAGRASLLEQEAAQLQQLMQDRACFADQRSKASSDLIMRAESLAQEKARLQAQQVQAVEERWRRQVSSLTEQLDAAQQQRDAVWSQLQNRGAAGPAAACAAEAAAN